MERLDPEMEQRVWERVGGRAAEPDLRGMELLCRESAAAFRQMAGMTRGEIRDALLRLHREEVEAAEMILGIRILGGQEPEPLPRYAVSQITLARGLAQSARRSREALDSYAAQESHRDYGAVFSLLRRQEAARLGTILGLIGRTRGKTG